MDCAFPLTTISLGMLVPWPEEGSRILAITQPFQPMVPEIGQTMMVVKS